MPDLVNVTYARTGRSIATDAMGMREMQARAFASREAQYLLLKAPPASGKSRALMFLGLDKLFNQGLKKVIVAVPERAIGGSFARTDLTTYGFFADWDFNPIYNLCTPGGETSKVTAFVNFLNDPAETILICTHATLRFAFEAAPEKQFNNTLLKTLPGEFIEPEVINKVLIPKVIQTKYPELTPEEVEEVRQHVVADSAIKNGEIKTVGDKSFVRMAGKFVNIEDRHIDLIDRVNPFQKAFEVLSKSVTAKLLKVIQETIDAGRVQMTDEEAVILYRDKIGPFMKSHGGREPNINAIDPLEKRMAEALVYLRNKRRQQASSAS